MQKTRWPTYTLSVCNYLQLTQGKTSLLVGHVPTEKRNLHFSFPPPHPITFSLGSTSSHTDKQNEKQSLRYSHISVLQGHKWWFGFFPQGLPHPTSDFLSATQMRDEKRCLYSNMEHVLTHRIYTDQSLGQTRDFSAQEWHICLNLLLKNNLYACSKP